MNRGTSLEISSALLRLLSEETSMPIIEMRIASHTFQAFRSITETRPDSISYLNGELNSAHSYSNLQGLLICDPTFVEKIQFLNQATSFVIVEDPKYFFALLFDKIGLFDSDEGLARHADNSHEWIDPSTQVAESARIHANVVIGKNCVISDGVTIHKSTQIGDNVRIKANSVIGGEGFGYAVRRGFSPLRIPHLGGVIIGDNVHIGSCNTIDRGTFGNTLISRDVKIDNGVQVAHNVTIGERTIVTAHVEFSGSVTVGNDCWIAPNASIREKITIGDNVLVGIGSVVVKNIESNLVVAGVPARTIRKQN